jgi:dihydroxyacetone kinase-like predicted kinase
MIIFHELFTVKGLHAGVKWVILILICKKTINSEEMIMAIQSIDAEDDQFAYRYDTQMLIEKRDEDLDEDAIADYITEHFEGNSLIAAGDEDLVKIHFHTNEPWKVLEYCSSVGEIFDIVIEDMIRQSDGKQG